MRGDSARLEQAQGGRGRSQEHGCWGAGITNTGQGEPAVRIPGRGPCTLEKVPREAWKRLVHCWRAQVQAGHSPQEGRAGGTLGKSLETREATRTESAALDRLQHFLPRARRLVRPLRGAVGH